MNSGSVKVKEPYNLSAAIIESSRDAIIASTLQGIITFWNEAAQLLYGYTAEETINQPLSLLAPPEKQDEISHILNEISEGRKISSFETIRKHKNGKYIPIFVTVSPIKDPQGRVIGASAITLDISQFKMLEERSNKILEATPDAIVIINHEGKINYINSQTEKLFGYEKSELIGQYVETLIPEPYRSRHPMHRREFFLNPHSRPMGTGMELYGQRKNLEIFPVEISLSPLDTVDGMVALAAIRDITERKIAEEGFRKILEATPDAIVIINLEGQITFVNTQTEKLFGYDKNELIGQYVESLIPEPYRSRHPGHRKSFFSNPHPRPMGIGMELFGQRKNSEIFPVEISLSPLKTKEGMVCVAAIRDITDRKKIDTMKNEFISIVSHELRTPLTSIQGSLDLLTAVQSDYNKDSLNLLSIAQRNCERLKQLIDDILDIQKIEYSGVGLNLKSTDINQLAKDVISLNQVYAQSLGIKIELFTSKFYPQVNIDPDKIMQVLTNLISNAIKFTAESGTITISISKKGNRVRTAVIDKGPGIPNEFKTHVFQKFSQLDSSSRRAHGGTGLGLSICKAIIEKHNGVIDYYNGPDRGTTFYFDLPLVNIEHDG